jgi:hypothetical protein
VYVFMLSIQETLFLFMSSEVMEGEGELERELIRALAGNIESHT